ncbi:hypothetical protein SELMODRAFT_430526 [Selaginella moellendorffii]|uniref:Uncharacterized protein n=1 Tax=Selaginella moellendorffii TaxID=88036 RepID=D8T9P1_SELML|nr:hypothetical protein SELMODRAFT_430526 [Selaginella moellendorffii]
MTPIPPHTSHNPQPFDVSISSDSPHRQLEFAVRLNEDGEGGQSAPAQSRTCTCSATGHTAKFSKEEAQNHKERSPEAAPFYYPRVVAMNNLVIQAEEAAFVEIGRVEGNVESQTAKVGVARVTKEEAAKCRAAKELEKATQLPPARRK